MSTERALNGKVAWVTGSSRGIGRAIAQTLAADGARIAIHGTHEMSPSAFGEGRSMDDLVDEIAAATGAEVGTDIIAVTGDLTDEGIVGAVADTVRSLMGPIDILVNCAGGDIGTAGVAGPEGGKPRGNNPVDISIEDLHVVLDRNLMTCVLCCREVAAQMRDRQAGVIVNLGSIAGLNRASHSALYSTAKAAVHHYTRCLADHMRPFGVRVNAVAPGDITSARFLKSRPVDEERLSEEVALTRYGRLEEVANAVRFLVSDDSSYISGQVIRIDGGSQCWAG